MEPSSTAKYQYQWENMQEQPNKDGKALTAGKRSKCRQETFLITIIFFCLVP
jgi:hypothetical protein